MACPAGAARQAEVAGVRVALVDHVGEAQVSVEAVGGHHVRIDVDPKSDRRTLTVRVDLPESGRNRWPAEDIQVIDEGGEPVAVRRNGTEWHRLFLSVPPTPGSYFVRVVDPPGGKVGVRLPSEADRTATDAGTGLRATVCPWFDARRAALSIRFDDSHPTHLSKAIPILREYGYKGTFMINPGNPDYQEHRDAWEACAARGDQEFANHTMHHRGAAGEEEFQRELGEASEYIWGLFPHKSKLLALSRGGGTTWVTKRPFRTYLDKYHLFAVGGSLGMDDVYGNRVAAFRTHLERHVERGLWCRAHFHYIGDGLSTSEANFRAALDVVKEHEPGLWIAGMADVHKYQEERLAAKLAFQNAGPDRATLMVSCLTDPSLFDQPLTIELAVSERWSPENVTVRDGASKVVSIRRKAGPEGVVLRFDVAPTDGAYTVERVRRTSAE
ncbi:MAG: polysaccharide deacetylase family protein [Planctomycetota bacterium]